MSRSDLGDSPNNVLVSRLYALTDQLQERLWEAEAVRARCTKAQEAHTWPDMRLAAQLLADANRAR